MITSLRPIIGLSDPCRQRDRDNYLERLFRARALVRQIQKAARIAAPALWWWLA